MSALRRPARLLAVLAAALGAAAACADASDETTVTPPPPSVVPTNDGAAPDGAADAAPDAADARVAIETCTPDGWCAAALPDLHALGLDAMRIVGLTADAVGGAWAVTNANQLAGGSSTSHLMHWEGGAWKATFGTGVTQTSLFEGHLEAIASNGAGVLVAVGETSNFSGKAMVLRVDAAGKVAIDTPPALANLVAVAFTSPNEVWALDQSGILYRTHLAVDGGAPTWTAVPTPHPAVPENFTNGPSAIFTSVTDGGPLYLAGQVNGTFGESGFVPGYGYVDIRSAVSDGGSSWRSSTVATSTSIQAGVESAPSRLWLAAVDQNAGEPLLIGSVASDGGDAGGGLAWPVADGPLSTGATALWAASQTDVWAVGQVGRVFHYDGTRWQDAKLALNGVPATTNGLFAITGLPSGEIWAGGQNVSLHRAGKP